MNQESTDKKVAQLLERRWERLKVPAWGEREAELQKTIIENLDEPRMKGLLAAMIENPEDHEELMRELIQNRGLSAHDPYEIFLNTVRIGISVVRASLAESMRAADLNAALVLTEQAVGLAIKIKDWRAAEECWLQLDRMASDIGQVPPGLHKVAVLRISEILEKVEKYEDAAECVSVLRETALAEGDAATALNLKLRIGEIKRKEGLFEEAEKIFKESIEEATDRLEDAGLSARGWLGLARICNAGSDTDETLRCYRNAFSESAAAQANGVMIETGGELGLLYAQVEDYENSWDCLNKSMNAALGEKDVDAQVKIVARMWYACENLKKWGDYLVALRTTRHFAQAEEREELLGPVLLSFARVHKALGNLEEALRHLEEAREAFTAANDFKGIAEAEELMGLIGK